MDLINRPLALFDEPYQSNQIATKFKILLSNTLKKKISGFGMVLRK
jgi:hypothetical protein